MIGVSIENLPEAIDNEFKIYSKEVMDQIKEITKDTAKDLVTETKSRAPGPGPRRWKYRNAITYSITKDTPNDFIATWHVKAPEHRLTHLLENPHVMKNQYGVFGQYPGRRFIRESLEIVAPNYERKIGKAIES